MDKLRVVIADDERPAREFLKSALRGFEFVEIGFLAPDHFDSVRTVVRFADDLDKLKAAQSGFKKLTRRAFIIGYDDSEFIHKYSIRVRFYRESNRNPGSRSRRARKFHLRPAAVVERK